MLHDGLEGAISTYLIVDPEPILVDPGPAPTLPNLRAALAERGLGVRDLRAVVLTHVHLDHAGVTGWLAAENPGLRVVVHEEGAPHLVEPERLVASTRRTFGDAHDRLWGEVRPVPAEALVPWRGGDGPPLRGFRPRATPGHIAHHLAYEHEFSDTLFAGDSLGIILDPGAPPHPPTPPPSLDLDAWARTLDELGRSEVGFAAVAHFGVHPRPAELAGALARRLLEVRERVERSFGGDVDDSAERYDADVRAWLRPHAEDPAHIDRYFGVFSARKDWEGVRFYLERQRR